MAKKERITFYNPSDYTDFHEQNNLYTEEFKRVYIGESIF